MSNPEHSKDGTSDEIDLSQFFRLIGAGFRKAFSCLLTVFLYLKRNIWWFAGLILAGGLAGYLMDQNGEERQQIEVVVTPNLDENDYLFSTRTYLYDVVEEIQSEISARDTAFFKELGMDIDRMTGFEIGISPIIPLSKEVLEGDQQILEVLQELGDSDAISEMAASALKSQVIRDHRLIFAFSDLEIGEDYARKLLEYINSNTYYSRIVGIQKGNALERIESNDSLIKQIDVLVETYTSKIGRDRQGTTGQLVVDNQEILDIPALLRLKNNLQSETEMKRLEFEMKQGPVTVVNFGEPHKLVQPLFKRNLVQFPLIFISAFLLVSLIGYLNRKAKDLHMQ